jgi:hypothetical protein
MNKNLATLKKTENPLCVEIATDWTTGRQCGGSFEFSGSCGQTPITDKNH